MSHWVVASTTIVACLTSCGPRMRPDQTLVKENAQLREQVLALQAAASRDHSSSGSQVMLDNTELLTLKSQHSQTDYQLKVWFPRSYRESAKRYPVLYVLDAETNFGGVSYIVQRLIKDQLIPEILLIGIAYDVDYDRFYRMRSLDLTPTEVTTFRPGGIHHPSGGAEPFSRFIQAELIPHVDRTYRTQVSERALYGHSFGGLFGTYVLLHHPEMFNRYLLLSPSLWWDRKTLYGDLDRLPPRIGPTRLFMASGDLEPHIDDHQTAFTELLMRQDVGGLTIESEVLDNETHRTIFGPGFTRGLRFLYAT